MSRTQIALAGRIKAGDVVLVDGVARAIDKVKRAQGRKPAVGENLHLVVENGDIVRINSSAGIRVVTRTTP